MWGRSPGAAKPLLRTFTAGLEARGRRGKTVLATLAQSLVPARSHKVVSKGPALVRLGDEGQGMRVRARRYERPPRAAGSPQ